MKIESLIFKQWLSVTFVSVLLLGASFLIYFILFTFFERLGNSDGQYGFVSILRVGYGSFLLYFAPRIFISLSAFLILIGLLILFKLKKKWYHYYAILLAIPFLILYL